MRERNRRQPEVVDFDHHAPEHAADPYGSFGRVRERCPVAFSRRYGGFWLVTGYEQVARIAKDPESFTAGLVVEDGTAATHVPRDPIGVVYPPLELEPPEFAGYRRLLLPYMTPRAVDAMEGGIHYWVDWFIDRVAERGSMSVTDFATAVPSSITVDWLGLPPADWRFYWSALHNPDKSLESQDFARLCDQIRPELEARRVSPRSDLLSVIANAVVNGELIDLERALGTTLFLIAGGTETTGDLFGHAVVHLDQHRDVHQRLIEDDRFMRTATEEYLRVATPIVSNGRVAKCPVEIDGFRVEEGDQVLNAWASANRDPGVFADPDEVNLERWPNRHLSFGIGPHRCLGSNLARAMFRVMTRRFLQRLPDFRVVAAEPIPDRHVFASFARLDVEFTPTGRLLPEDAPPPQFQASYEHATQAEQRP